MPETTRHADPAQAQAEPVDPDLQAQARPGHGIPSQDLDPASQFRIGPAEAQREAQSVLMGGGIVAGAAAGGAVGVAVAGPVGVLVGAALGAVAGALGGAAVGDSASPAAPAAPASPASSEPAAAGRVRLHIDDSGGSGRPVVLIHGWPLSAEAWAPQVGALQAAGYRVVAYDRRGFGRSEQPETGYDYDHLADDLAQVLEGCDLHDATLVGFSMGGGEVLRYISRHGESRLHSVVLAAAVPPCLLQAPDNPDGPLPPDQAEQMRQALVQDRPAFFDQFTRDFYSAGGVLQVSEAQRAEATGLCLQSAPQAALACMDAFARTDFRADLAQVTVPMLVLHGDADAVVPLAGSGLRSHRAVPHSRLVVIPGGPHGLNLSHAPAFNDALLGFLQG